MSGGYFSYALLAALATALLVAAYTDIKRREIDNTLNAAIALAAPVWWLASGMGWSAIGFQLALCAITFAIACALFATGQMGGGDVKLLTALALWFSPSAFLQLVVLMAVLGGAGSVAMAACNMQRRPGERGRDALAAMAAIGWVGCAGAVLFALALHRPLVSGAALQSIRVALPPTWLVIAAAIVLVAGFLFGFLHIVRRQKARLPIPYGVAISAAGLWVLGERALQAAPVAG
ncbi:prepilin peptidase [Novosphingobium sp. 1949]|uniref:Prepilin peptidase n=1 Tax=Novosphingobium organovorum TaxID=2930092 RepID=A0ABT0BB91_9SPHN|nr:prepilin peptidase [Novosphingobium organovorum]MCJ2182331.1 prepilin peptidase [Novosphingobium organovorum]